MNKHTKKPWTILIAIALAMIVGTLVGQETAIFGVTLYSIFNVGGTLFLNALTLIVVPLVSASIITGIARVGSDSALGRLGIKMFSFYIGTILIAILFGLFLVNWIQPGADMAHASATSEHLLAFQANFKAHESQSIASVLLQTIPSNIVAAFSGQMVGLVFFSLLFGYALSKIDEHHSQALQTFWQAIFKTMIQVTHILMKVLPYGVFCLVAKVFATTGLESLVSLALFFLTVLLSLASFMFIGLPLLLKFIGRVSPIRHFQAMAPALVTAFSTSSSSATLPITLDCVEKRAGVSHRITSLVVPLGTSINMSGSALYECVAALFVAQAYGIEIAVTTQIVVVLMALITSIGVAGIPSASLVAIILILKAIGLPAEGIGLFIAVDRILDMCRTMVNVFSDSCCAVLVARSEGEKDVLSKPMQEL